MNAQIEEAFQRIFRRIEATIPERDTNKLTLYPISNPVEPYIPVAANKEPISGPAYTPGPRKLTIEEYQKRQKQHQGKTPPRPKQRKSRGGKRHRAAKQIKDFKRLIDIVESSEEKTKYAILLQKARKERYARKNHQ